MANNANISSPANKRNISNCSFVLAKKFCSSEIKFILSSLVGNSLEDVNLITKQFKKRLKRYELNKANLIRRSEQKKKTLTPEENRLLLSNKVCLISAPVKKISSFMLFSLSEYPKAAKKNSGPLLKIKSHTSYIEKRAKWNELTPSQKLKYYNEAKILRKKLLDDYYNWWKTADKELIAKENSRREKLNQIRKKINMPPIKYLIDPHIS
ncbi:hypothetical protein BB561_001819 [Smittium simulii]|uniref:HMG box domain-containing protein n=1 Tax=Smittium simulii TaxID=133385 RepID=A0A2T9YT02_9FUNG|nr:hypothetical protein BB561_001819 [Smittium simulii]